MEESDDPYKILGVSSNATDKEIRNAYRKAALRWHPDKNNENRQEATQKFAKISNAYEILSDHARRQEYDRLQHMPNTHAGFHDDFFAHFGRSSGFHDPFSVFESVFRQEFGGPEANFSQSTGFGGGMRSPFFGPSLFGGSIFGGRDPFEDMFSTSMRQMHGMSGHPSNPPQQAQSQSSSFFYSSSSSSLRGGNRGGESVTTQTTTRIVNGKRQSVTERITQKADGTVHREVLDQSGDPDFATLETDGRDRPALLDEVHDTEKYSSSKRKRGATCKQSDPPAKGGSKL